MYSPVIKGLVGSDTSISRAQPHLQPWLSKVKVPYTSSVVSASCRPGTWTAEWLLGQSFDDGLKNGPGPCLAQPPGNTPGTAVGSSGSCSQTGRFVGSVSSVSWGFGTPAATWLSSRPRNCPAPTPRSPPLPPAFTP